MIDLELTLAEREAFEDQLVNSHRTRTQARILDKDENYIAELPGRITAGAVQVDSDSEITRSLSLTVVDAGRRIRLEPQSPADGAVHSDNFIAIEYGVWVESLDRWVDVPVFNGPITLVERQGAEVKIEAQGKESLLLAPHYAGQGYTLRGGTRLDHAIEAVCRRQGEEKLKLPVLSKRLPKARVVGPSSEPWKVINGGEVTAKGREIKSLISRASNDDLNAYFDGRGYLVTRSRASSPVFTFTERHLLDNPTLRYDLASFRNTVIVRGGRRKKANKRDDNRPSARTNARVSLPAPHPLSPQSLARHGEPRFLVEFVDADGLKTNRECRRRGHAVLDRVSREGVDASFPSLPVPHLEEDDLVTLMTDEIGSLTFPLRTFTLPLTPTDSMQVGATKPVHR